MKIELTREECNDILNQLSNEIKIGFAKKVEGALKRELKEVKRIETRVANKQSSLKKKLASIVNLAEKRRKELINNQTTSEKIFKAKLKSLNIKYEFQKIVYTERTFYILDFYLPDQKLVIELDGEYHNSIEQKIKDATRTKTLNILGYKKIKRFSNKRAEEMKDLEIENIIKKVRN